MTCTVTTTLHHVGGVENRADVTATPPPGTFLDNSPVTAFDTAKVEVVVPVTG